jgi:hypothetical protein
MRLSTLLIFVVACTQNRADRALSEYRDLRDRMCACTTSQCRGEVNADLTAWDKTESGTILSKTPKGEITEAQTKEIDPIEAEIKRCRRGG